MRQAELPRPLLSDPAVRSYTLLGAGALGLLFVLLTGLGCGPWCFLPLVIGAAGLYLRWPVIPFLFLAAVGMLLGIRQGAGQGMAALSSRSTHTVSNWLLCACVLGYVVVFFRLRSLTRSAFPGSAEAVRERGHLALPSQAAPGQNLRNGERRDPGLVVPLEISLLALSVPVWALLAMVALRALPRSSGRLDLDSWTWRGLVACWTLTAGMLLVSAVFRHLRQRQMTRAEARLFLQDQLWLETRRDQRRLNRWLVGYLNRRRRKDNP